MAKKVPHVILMLGTHVPGIEEHVEKIIDAERPSKLLVEFLSSRQSRVEFESNLRRDLAGLMHSKEVSEAFVSRMYALARRKGVAFHFLEQLSEAREKQALGYAGRSFQRMSLVGSAVSSGYLDSAIRVFLEANGYALSRDVLREAEWIRDIVTAAKASPRPVAVFAGGAHSNIVKQLVALGVKVTLYNNSYDAPVTNAHIDTNYHRLRRGMILKAIFRDYFFLHLAQTYGLGNADLPRVLHALPYNKKLRSFTPAEIEDFLQGVGISAPVRQRANFEKLLATRGIRLPTIAEMGEILKTAGLPPFRKVKIFEPKRGE